ncbi:serine hydrolase domain-containing protein [Alteromonas gracilis]|uniref:serine hydrolase domain-containing protein n=1 Tax=Alteromonas gracilis TaxID=1479524 RepID=UPI003735736E
MKGIATLSLSAQWLFNIIKITAILFTLPVSAQSLNPGQAELDNYLTSLSTNNKMMTAVYVSKNGTPLYEHYAGFASVEKVVPITAQTRFRIGSISKTFTAVLVMRLIEKNKLSLNTKLDQFFPDIPNASDISIKHLLSHRSGIFSYTNDPEYMRYRTTPQTKAQMLSRIQAFQPEFKPGTKYNYSNSNYAILSYIVESLHNKSLAEVITDEITNPLNLNNTYVGNNTETEEHEAFSYRFNNLWIKQPETHMSVPHGAGSIVSTAKDTNQFFSALFTGKLVSTSSLTAMMALENGYGLGLAGEPFGEKRFYGHFGGIDGFVSAAGYNTEDGLNITVLSNAVNYNFNDVLITVLQSMYGLPIDKKL